MIQILRNRFFLRASVVVTLLVAVFVTMRVAPTKHAQADGLQPSISVLSPNGGEAYQVGSTVRISWAQSNVDVVTIGLKSCSSCLEWIGFNNVPVDIMSASGFVDWTVPSWIAPGNTYKIWIIGYRAGVGSQTDESNGQFTIASQAPLAAALSATTPLPQTYAQGQTNAEFTRVNFSAIGDDVALSSVTLQAAPTASGAGVVHLSVYAGSTLLGTAQQFDEKNGSAVVYFTTPLVIPRYTTVTLTLKADITYDAFEHVALGITNASAAVNGQPVLVLNLPVYGAPMYFSEK